MGGLSGDKSMDATTMRAVVAYIAELRRDRDYHRAIERGTDSDTQIAKHGRSQGHGDGDERYSSNCPGQSGHNV